MSYNPNWDNPQISITLAPVGNDNMPWHDAGNVRLTTLAGPVNVSGIQAPVDHRPVLVIMNLSGQNVTFQDANTSSSAGNRIVTGTAANVVLANGASLTLQYDLTDTVWRIVGKWQ